VEAAVDAVTPGALAKSVTLERRIDAAAGPVWGDSHRLQQVVWNLLSNAIKFTGSGGRVGVTVDREDPHVVVRVADTGQGIAPEFLPFIFDRFRQADSTTTRAHGGLGLGLAIVHYLVTLHRATVRAVAHGARPAGAPPPDGARGHRRRHRRRPAAAAGRHPRPRRRRRRRHA